MSNSSRSLRNPGRFVWVLGVLLGLFVLSPGSALGQTDAFGTRLDGTVELGVRGFLAGVPDSAKGKFEEYRNIPSGLFLEDLQLRLVTDDKLYSLEFRAQDAWQDDQIFRLRGSRLGSYQLELDFEEAWHTFSNTGLSPFVETGRGIFELDDALQATLQDTVAADRPDILESFLDNNAVPIELLTPRQTGRIAFKLTPTPEWDIGARWTNMQKEDGRPMGLTYGFGPTTEVTEPVDQTINDLRLSGGFVGEAWQLQLNYTLSSFTNNVDALIADNPVRITDDATAGPVRGRLDLTPDNIAHNVALAGAVRLPLRSRLVGTASYGIRRQDEAFLPHTINSAITSPLLALPANSLDGDVRTTLVNLRLTSQPWRRVSLAARYRSYDFDNQTPVLTFPARVRTDQRLIEGPFENQRYSYRKQNAGADVQWRPRPVSVKLAYDWERWDRDDTEREVDRTDEHTAKVSLDMTPLDWLLLRTSYSHSWRDGTEYNQVVDLQLPALRKYDMADRERDRVEFLAQIIPLKGPTFTATYSLRNDDYDESVYGVQDYESWTAGVDLSWSPSEAVAVFASYMREEFDRRHRSRYRRSAFGNNPAVDTVANDWVSRDQDDVDTYGFGLDAALIPGSLNLHVRYDFSLANGTMLASNPFTITNDNALAADFPEITQKLHELEASLRYPILDRWSAELRYELDRFDQEDFRIDDIQPFMGRTDIFLGARSPDYNASMLSLIVGYNF